MSKVVKSIDVQVPVRTVYNQWTQFESFPQFMEGVEAVQQRDDTHLHWRATIAGKTEEWDAEIVEQRPDQTVIWRSTSGAPNSGTVSFLALGNDATRITLTLEYEPQGPVERAGDALGMLDRRVQGDLQRFKEFIESRQEETGAWRGEVHGARPQSQSSS